MNTYRNFSREAMGLLAVYAALSSLPCGADDSIPIGTAQSHVAYGPDVERNNSPALGRVRADLAHLRGITGKGVTIAILDTGISAGHGEFAGSGRLAPGFNAIDGSADVSDRRGHGSHVAGILGASRNGKGTYGIAYGATLLPVKVFADSGSGYTQFLDRGLRYAIGKASVVNMSVGAAHSFDSSAMREAVQAGMLLVASAGNEGAPHPGWPARFAREPWAGDRIIAVGAVDAANHLAPFSNRAGDAAAWYLVAPGVSILSSYKDNQYATMSGTSMAAPLVTGAAALVMQMWPSLRAEEVATILFVTATDLGAPGIDPVYGRGLLNVERALQPVGALTTTTWNGKTIHVLEGSLQPSAATSRLWGLAAAGQLRVVGLDDFERDFGVDLGGAVARPPSMSLDEVLDRMDRRIEVVEQVLDESVWLAAAYEHPLRPEEAGRDRLAAFSLLARNGDGDETALGMGATAHAYFGAGGLYLAPDLPLSQVAALTNPYFSLLPGASHAAVAGRVRGFKLKLGALSSGANPLLASQTRTMPTSSTLPHASSGVFEISRQFQGGAFSLSVSQTHESNAWLGSYSTGAVSLGNEAATSSVQLAGALLLMPKLALAGQAAYGVTPGGGPRDSLIADVTQIRTNAFSLALIAADSMRPGDRLSLSLSQPMRTYAGHITMDVLSATGSGLQTREKLVFSMVPLGREMRAELNYHAPLTALSSFGINLMLRHEANNMAEAETETLLALRYAQAF